MESASDSLSVDSYQSGAHEGDRMEETWQRACSCSPLCTRAGPCLSVFPRSCTHSRPLSFPDLFMQVAQGSESSSSCFPSINSPSPVHCSYRKLSGLGDGPGVVQLAIGAFWTGISFEVDQINGPRKTLYPQSSWRLWARELEASWAPGVDPQRSSPPGCHTSLCPPTTSYCGTHR